EIPLSLPLHLEEPTPPRPQAAPVLQVEEPAPPRPKEPAQEVMRSQAPTPPPRKTSEDTIYPFRDTPAKLRRASEDTVYLRDSPSALLESELATEQDVPSERVGFMSSPPPKPTLQPEEHVAEAPPAPPSPPASPPLPLFSAKDVFTCHKGELPMGVSRLQEPTCTEHVVQHAKFSEDRQSNPRWCGWELCREAQARRQKCTRCSQALESFFDHRCPKCSAPVCVKCFTGQHQLSWFRCRNCGDQDANRSALQSNMWIFHAYCSTTRVFSDLSRGVSSVLQPCQSSKAPQALPRSDAGGGQAPLPANRTRLPAAWQAYEPAARPPPPRGHVLPPPPPPLSSDLPALLGRTPAAPAADVFKTQLPGEMRR
ncbi:unnamed protein product, partial [Effrenium voratum]